MSGSQYDSAQRSFLCLFPCAKVSVAASGAAFKNPWEQLKESITLTQSSFDVPEWVGYLAYEMGGYSDSQVVIPQEAPDYPIAQFFRYPVVLVYHHVTQKLTVFVDSENVAPEKMRELTIRLKESEGGDEVKRSSSKVYSTQPLEEKHSYYKKVLRAKERIIQGDIYQVNISQECQFKGEFTAFDLFKRLYTKNPAPFSAYLNMSDDHKIVSSSPERLLRSLQNKLETRPIKGTAPRGKNKAEDEKNRQMLLSSQKDKSELLMITDLMRNDLGKVAAPGSVRTEKIWNCEAYHNVFHLLSIITAETKETINPIDVLREVFPGGSITGCPKIRAMEIIAEIENTSRGVYTGSIGYISTHGNFDFNIAIRTLDIVGDVIKLRLGGAIVSDSSPENEYEETLDKGRSIFEVLL